VHNGESQVTTTFRDPRLELEITNILNSLKLSGPIVLQAIISNDGLLNVIECNPRFGGASTASIEVGLDILFWSLVEVLEGNVNHLLFKRFPKEIRQIRIPYDIHLNLNDTNF
jgi:carbamoyl-phosphate synthase large subunit